MNIMGSSCSIQRERSMNESSRLRRSNAAARVDNGNTDGNSGGIYHFSSLRHSVISAIPDVCIATLYPVEDNYVNVGDGRRSPKSLAELATDALCRSLPYLEGELPQGLPQDVVEDIIQSLLRHSALNATTLRALRLCEFGQLSLAKCRGVTDSWLEPLRSGSSSSNSSSPIPSATSSPELCPLNHEDGVESMDLDDERNVQGELFYGTFDACKSEEMSSQASTSSFVSATSQLMTETPRSPTATVLQTPAPAMDGVTIIDSDDSKQAFAQGGHSSYASATTNLVLLDLSGSQRLTDRGLMQLTDLAKLEVARLDDCHAIVGRGLLAFSSSHRLHTLSLANCRRLTDEAVINISHLMSLESLSLDGCRCITDRSLAAVADLYGLRRLDLSKCDLVTDEGLEHLEHLEALEELSLGWCRQITDHGINQLTTHSGRDSTLRILRLARCAITDLGVRHLARLSGLEELDLNGCSRIDSTVLGETLQRLGRLQVLDVSYCPAILRSGWQGKIPALKSLDLCYAGVRDSHVRKFTSLPELEELNLDSCPVGDWAIGHLADNNVLPKIRSLDLADTNLTDFGMVHLAKFTHLTKLSLFYCNITNTGLRHISELADLEVLNLDSRDITDEGLRHLRKLKKLKALDVFSGRVTDAGCSHIANIKSLESLELCGGGIGDLGCSLLAGLENLTSLNLSQNERITNRGAAALAALSQLKALNLSNTRVNAAALCFLGGLVKLQSLALYGCRGIEGGQGLDKLQNGLPNLRCIRLSNVSVQDGVIISSPSDMDSEASMSPYDDRGDDSD